VRIGPAAKMLGVSPWALRDNGPVFVCNTSV